MKWYKGDIAQAIVFSKSKGAIFVVYIQGKDEQSEKITALIENGELGTKLEQEQYVAIKLEAGSTPHQQFSEIYKEPSIPSIYFIGKNGAPLGIITGKDDLNMIPKIIDDILLKAGLLQNRPANPSESLIQNEQSNGSSNVVCENGACQISNEASSINKDHKTSENTEKEEDSELLAEEKVNRAKKLLENKREQKLFEEKENERLKEIERRKMGQGVQQLKKWQEDQEMKQLKEERDREKRENQEARERVLAQIAQDKADRLAKTQPQSAPELNMPKSTPPSVSANINNSNITRLHFKLPDGSSNTKEFDMSDSLDSVVSYIKSNLKIPFNNFVLSTTFPRRDFSNNDYSQSLLDLQLTPNAVILILPLKSGAVSTNPGGSLTALIWTLLAPIWNVIGFVRNFIFGTNPNAGGNKRPSDDTAEPRKRNKLISLVVKSGNEDGGSKENLAKTLQLFEREEEMFSKTLPIMYKILGENYTLSSKCYFTSLKPHAILVLDDLTTFGFDMIPRHEGFDLKGSLRVVEKLAKFHAASVIMCEKDPSLVKHYHGGLFQSDKEMIQDWVRASYRGLIDACLRWPEYEKYGHKLQALGDEAIRRSFQAKEKELNKFHVLNHGDLWTNNVMVSKDLSGNLKDLRFVDFQMVIFTSPAVDLHYFLATSMSNDFTLNNIEVILDHYHGQLLACLRKLHCSIAGIPTKEEFMKDFRNRAFYGLLAAATVLPFVKSSPRPDASFDNMVNDESVDGFRLHAYNNERYRNYMQLLLPYFDELGILD